MGANSEPTEKIIFTESAVLTIRPQKDDTKAAAKPAAWTTMSTPQARHTSRSPAGESPEAVEQKVQSQVMIALDRIGETVLDQGDVQMGDVGVKLDFESASGTPRPEDSQDEELLLAKKHPIGACAARSDTPPLSAKEKLVPTSQGDLFKEMMKAMNKTLAQTMAATLAPLAKQSEIQAEQISRIAQVVDSLSAASALGLPRLQEVGTVTPNVSSSSCEPTAPSTASLEIPQDQPGRGREFQRGSNASSPRRSRSLKSRWRKDASSVCPLPKTSLLERYEDGGSTEDDRDQELL